jgi:hypothetical protein
MGTGSQLRAVGREREREKKVSGLGANLGIDCIVCKLGFSVYSEKSSVFVFYK